MENTIFYRLLDSDLSSGLKRYPPFDQQLARPVVLKSVVLEIVINLTASCLIKSLLFSGQRLSKV